MIDTGTIGSDFVSTRFLHTHKLPNYKLSKRISLHKVGNKESDTDSLSLYSPLKITFLKDDKPIDFRPQPWRFLSYGIRDYDCILGISFLTQALASINIPNRTLYIGTLKETFNTISKSSVTCNSTNTSSLVTITPKNFSKEKIWEQFPQLFPTVKPNILPLLRKINHDIPIKYLNGKLLHHCIPIPTSYYGHLKERLNQNLQAR
jgi:hypothetical protein